MGGRSRITFTSVDSRSVITFRTAGSYRHLSDFDLFRLISEECNNGGVITPGVMTVFPKPIPAAETDQELLERVQRNIKRRLDQHRKKYPKPVNRTLVEKAIQIVA